jgi:NADH:ubiquinone oxidoreductase subunit 6 (subunit J)
MNKFWTSLRVGVNTSLRFSLPASFKLLVKLRHVANMIAGAVMSLFVAVMLNCPIKQRRDKHTWNYLIRVNIAARGRFFVNEVISNLSICTKNTYTDKYDYD